MEKVLKLRCSVNPGHKLQSLTIYGKENLLTVTFHPLMDKSIQQGPTVITEGGASISVDFKLVLASWVLGGAGKEKKHIILFQSSKEHIFGLSQGQAPPPNPSCQGSIAQDCALFSGVIQWGVVTWPYHVLIGCPFCGHIINTHVSSLLRYTLHTPGFPGMLPLWDL